ncbi:MAG: type III-A CRISPR-associated RAMP protein Csm3 [Thermodesulfobacteriota bacterium]
MRLKEIREIKGKIILRSGLHIGSGDMEMRIGGVDNTVVKHPHSNDPYIPGSSIKGKVRSLLELRSGLMGRTRGNPVSLGLLRELKGDEKDQCEKILKLFGSSGADSDEELSLGPTRVSFADCPLNREWREDEAKHNGVFTEVKSENRINRIQGTARDPRFTERVPAGTEFDFSVTLKEFEGDGDLLEFLFKGLKLLEMDSLGGSGSRGYGRIFFEFIDEAMKEEFEKVTP